MNTTAQCLSGYEWSFSSINQSPCVVASELAEVCAGAQFTLSPLAVGVVYSGPSVDGANACICSSVYYAVLSACAYCQGRSYIRWSSYTTNCSTVYVQRFAEPIPKGVDVPLWAYQDVTVDDAFNTTLAQINATTPVSSTSLAGPTASGTDSSKTNIAGIAGGLVGGLIVVGLVAGFVSFCLIRRQSRSSRNENRIVDPQSQNMSRNIPASPYAVPGFASSSTFRGSDPRIPHPLTQRMVVENSFQDSAPLLSSRNARVPMNVQSLSVSPDEYLMTRLTPYNVPPSSSSNIVSSVSGSHESKRPLLGGTSSSLSNMSGSASPLSPSSPEDSKYRAPSSNQTATTSSLSYRHRQLADLEGTSTMSPLTTNSEQLPPYSEIVTTPSMIVP